MDVETFRDGRDLLAELFQLGHRDAGLAATLVVLRQAEAGPFAIEPVGGAGLERLGFLELAVEMGLHLGDHVVHGLIRNHAFLDQAAGIEFAGRLLVADLRVHQRLRHRRIIALVVAEAAIAEHVDDDVLAERLTVFGGDLGGVDDRFRVIAVDVEDRGFDHLRHIRGIGRGAREGGRCREADLVVDDEVHGAAGAVAGEAGQREAFRHDALTCEGGVAMQQQRHDLRATAIAFLRVGGARAASFDFVKELLGARLAQNDGVDDFQVGRVRREGEVDAVTVELTVG